MDAEEFLKILKARRSIRSFLPDEVAQKDIEKMIDAASFAPSGTNLQNWHFIVVSSREKKQQLLEAVSSEVSFISGRLKSAKAKEKFIAYSRFFTFLFQAPVIIAVIKKPYDSLTQRLLAKSEFSGKYLSNSDIQGPSAAVENLLLAAHALGYGSCWTTGPLIAREKLNEALGVKSPDEVLALVPIGRAASQVKAPERKKVSEITTYI